jgi:hypothetical protein
LINSVNKWSVSCRCLKWAILRNDVIVRRGKTLSYQENSSYLVQ